MQSPNGGVVTATALVIGAVAVGAAASGTKLKLQCGVLCRRRTSAMAKDTRRDFFADALRKLGDRAADKMLDRMSVVSSVWSKQQANEKTPEPVLEPGLLHDQGAGHYDRPWFRPPGAAPEAEFLDMCSRCRICVDVCPEMCIVPAQRHMGAPLGTPILFPNEAPCTLCGDCMDACPSGALLPIPGEFARIGLAHISEQTCIAYGEEHCTICHDACPVVPNAVVFPEDYHGTSPLIDPAACTGCGLCVTPCPTQPKSVEVRLRPIELIDGFSDKQEE